MASYGADTDWTNADGDQDMNNAANWSDGVPADNNTVAVTSPDLPTSNQAAFDGLTFDFVCAAGGVYDLGDFLSGGAAAGDITLHSDGFDEVTLPDSFGVLTVQAGCSGILSAVTSGTKIVLAGSGAYLDTGGNAFDGNVEASAGGAAFDWGDGGAVSGYFDAGGYAITHDGVSGDLTCDQAGNLDTGGDASIVDAEVTADTAISSESTVGAFTLSAGTLTGSADLHVNGNLSVAAGTNNWTGTAIMDDDGTLAIGSGQRVASLEINAAATAVGHVYTKTLAGTGSIAADGTVWKIDSRLDDDEPLAINDMTFGDAGGSPVRLMMIAYVNEVSQSEIALSGSIDSLTYTTSGSAVRTLAMTGGLDFGETPVEISGYSSADHPGAIEARYGGSFGDVTLGYPGRAGGGTLLIDGTWTLGGIAATDAANNDNNAVNFHAAYVEARAGVTWDFADASGDSKMTVAGTAAHVVALGNLLIQNLPDRTGEEPIHFHSTSGGSITHAGQGNHPSAYDVDEHVAPGQAALCGVG